MKLDWIAYDWAPVIPGGKKLGEQTFTTLRDTSFFHVDDGGWEIEQIAPGHVTIRAPWMPSPAHIMGDGYTFGPTAIASVSTEAPVTSVARDPSRLGASRAREGKSGKVPTPK